MHSRHEQMSIHMCTEVCDVQYLGILRWGMVINPLIGIPIMGWITMLHLCFDIYIYIYIYLSIYQSINLSISISTFILYLYQVSNCIYIYPSIYIFISISSSLSIPISMYLYIYTYTFSSPLGAPTISVTMSRLLQHRNLLPREAPPGQVTADKLVKTKDLPQDR